MEEKTREEYENDICELREKLAEKEQEIIDLSQHNLELKRLLDDCIKDRGNYYKLYRKCSGKLFDIFNGGLEFIDECRREANHIPS